MKRWTRTLPLLCLCAALCATLAAAEFQDPLSGAEPLNCRQMTELLFGGGEEAELMGLDEADPVEATLADYFAVREAGYRGDAALLSGDGAEMSASVAENNALRAERVREMEARLGLTVLDAAVTPRIDRERVVRNPDGSWTAYVYEWTYFDYDDLSDGVGGLDVSGFGTWHIVTVAQGQIIADEYDESDILGLNTLSEAGRAELSQSQADEAPGDEASLLGFSYYSDYNVNNAVQYAEAYYQNYNPAYANFNGKGGDCANFASQCIAAGGMPQVVCQPYGTDGWYYRSETNLSATWNGSTNLRRWMGDNRGLAVTASKSTVYAGSPVFYSTQGNGTFQHSAFCVGTNSAGTPIVNAHNNDRQHAFWNYYTGAAAIETVQLTSASFGSFSGYRNVGSDFYAYIVNPSVSRYVTNDGAGVVTSRSRTEGAGQVWRFVRQSDGSYQILSALDTDSLAMPCLAASETSSAVGAETYSGAAGQTWYIYWNSGQFPWGQGAYQFRPNSSDYVMNVAADGTALSLAPKSGDKEQLFQIYETQWVTLAKPTLAIHTVDRSTDNATFSWTALEGAGFYRLSVYLLGKDEEKTLAGAATVRSTSYTMTLEPGQYEAALEAVSADERTSNASDAYPFIIYRSYVISYDANGGEDAPEMQIKREAVDINLQEEIPTRTGYEFASWNSEENGTGDIYLPGAVYSNEEEVVLYAQWTANTYTLKLDPNYPNFIPLEQDQFSIVYDQPYGALPTPRRDRYEFAGWFTDPLEGELVTAEDIVTIPEDHTLYASWDYAVSYITSDVSRAGASCHVQTTVYRIPRGTLIACGYLNGQLIDVSTKEIGQEGDMILDSNIDMVRVIAVGPTRQPLCTANVISARQFR